MRKHIDRVLLVGATVVVLVFGTPVAIPTDVNYNPEDPSRWFGVPTEQTVSEH